MEFDQPKREGLYTEQFPNSMALLFLSVAVFVFFPPESYPSYFVIILSHYYNCLFSFLFSLVFVWGNQMPFQDCMCLWKELRFSQSGA